MTQSRILAWTVGAALAAGLLFKAAPAGAQEKGDEHPWNVSLSVGRVQMEGDFPTKGGLIVPLRLGYDYSDWWTFEGGLFVAPYLGQRKIKGQQITDDPNDPNNFVISTPLEASHTTAYGATLDALFHFTPWKRVDPYLAAGVMGIGFTDSFNDTTHDQYNAGLRGGGGVIYNINDEWGVRADFRGAIAQLGEKGTVNSTVDVGVRYVFGAHVAPDYHVAGGPKDSDADGLTDDEEINIYHTNPFDPDTDHDGLNDYDEVKKYHTDPLNPDTDYDGLKDGPEVFTYHTDPTKRDTDGGGVADGHEVIEDHTNPNDPSDDLILFTLNIQFDYDKSIIKPEYFKELDVIGLTMRRDPGSTGRIEGHCDKLLKSRKDYNDQLSERRAKACLDYIAAKCGIETSRMVAVGYGFSRPKAANDKVNGNPVNRRVEVYIRKSDGGATKMTDTVHTEAVPAPGVAVPVPAPTK